MADLNQMTLYHYCHKSCRPFHNIMRLPKAEAFRLARELAEKNPQTTAFYRFADFENYYSRRMWTDVLLHERFTRLGGRPEQKHPLFFTLGGSDFLDRWFDCGTVYGLPLAAIPDDAVSFTIGDSCAAAERGKEAIFLTKAQLADVLYTDPATAETFLRETGQSCTYIEAQLWQDAGLAYAYRVR